MMASSPLFALGSKVRLRADPSVRGIVSNQPRPHGESWEYEVHVLGQERWYAESQLVAADDTLQPRWLENRDELLVRLLEAKLAHPLTDALYAYRASRTEFEAYQFRPALKFLRNGSRGLLIADEVGLGKTIEAAIIYLELKARMNISRVLILCPSRLCQKWQSELQNRFEEQFEILNSERIRQLFASYEKGHSRDFRAIASFETMRRSGVYSTWTELQIPLDLLIVDEAHYLRNEGAKTRHLGLALTNAAAASVFLSATPLHLRSRDLFNLLTLLAPEEFDDHRLFDDQIEPNTPLNEATRHVAAQRFDDAFRSLRRLELTVLKDRYRNNPYYLDVLARLHRLRDRREVPRAEIVEIQTSLGELNTLASVLSRTRKREMTSAAVRSAHTVSVDLTDSERRLYDLVLSRVQSAMQANPGTAPGFGTIMEERQAASCLPAVAEKLSEIHRRGTVDAEVDVSPFELFADDPAPANRPVPHGLQVVHALQNTDSKLAKLLEVIEHVSQENPESKILLFSFFRGTLRYLEKQLKARGIHPLVLNGDVKMPERYRLIDQFKDDPGISIMLSSEVGAEGLDFQFCDVLVNYDLPWNPMQVEQRIGRLDRFGQKHDKIRIYNFYIKDTIETRIFERLYERIKLFERSIGDLEDILGSEIQQLTARVLSGSLSPGEQTQLADEAANRIVRRQWADEELERDKDALFGQGAIIDQRIEASLHSGRFISRHEVEALICTFIAEQHPKSHIFRDPEDATAMIEFDQSLLDHLRKVIEKEGLQSRVSSKLQDALSGSRRLRLTFDSDTARDRKELEFVTISHPLSVAARAYWKSRALAGLPCGRVSIPGPATEAGAGAFFIYEIEVKAVNSEVILEPVIVLDDGRIAALSAQSLLRHLQTQMPSTHVPDPDSELMLQLMATADQVIAEKRAALETAAMRRNEAAFVARESVIRNSFGARIARDTRLLNEAKDERIRRMYASMVSKHRGGLETKLDELRRLKDVGVSSRPIIGGRIRINCADRQVSAARS